MSDGSDSFDISKNGIQVSGGSDSFDISKNGIRMSDGSDSVDISGNGIQIHEGADSVGIHDDGIKVYADDNKVSITDEGVKVSAEDGTDASITADGIEVGYADVTHLEITQNGGVVNIFSMDGIDKLTVKCDRKVKKSGRYEDRELSLRVEQDEFWQIFIPKDWELEEFEANVIGGSLKADQLRAHDTELNAVSGNISILQESGHRLEIGCVNGNVAWTAANPTDMDVDTDCTKGNVVLTFPAGMDPAQFGYEIACEKGNVNCPHFAVDGRQEKNVAGADGMPNLKLDTVKGTIDIRIKEE